MGLAARASTVPVEVARAHLSRVVESSALGGSERRRELLRFLAEESLAGRVETLKAYTIGTQVLGRPPRFDPQVDPIVRVEVGRLRAALDRYYREHPDARVVLSIPKGQYGVVFANPEPQNAPTGARLEQGPAPIAVLPFLDLGSDPENAHLADGIPEELGYRLSQSPEVVTLISLPRAALASSSVDAAQAIERLAPRFAIRGKVKAVDGRIRLQVGLLDVSADREVWHQRFDSDLSSQHVFEIEDEICARIAGELADGYGVIARIITAEAEGRGPAELLEHEAMLRVHHAFAAPSAEGFAEAVKILEYALDRSPSAARAQAGLSDILFTAWWLGIPGIERDLDRAMSLARRAVASNPHGADGHAALAYAHFGQGHSRLFRLELQQTLEIDNSPARKCAAGLMLTLDGDLREGEALCRSALALNPYVPNWWRVVPCLRRALDGEFEEALTEARRIGDSAAFVGPALRLSLAGHLGHEDGAADAEELIAYCPDFAEDGVQSVKRIFHDPEAQEMVLGGIRATGLLLTN